MAPLEFPAFVSVGQGVVPILVVNVLVTCGVVFVVVSDVVVVSQIVPVNIKHAD